MTNSEFVNRECADILARAMCGFTLDDSPNHMHNEQIIKTRIEVYAKDKDEYDDHFRRIRDEERSGFMFNEIARMFVYNGRHTALVEYQVTTKENIDLLRDDGVDAVPDWICVYKVRFVGDYTANDNNEVAYASYDKQIQYKDLEFEMTKLGLEGLIECGRR